jgi:hypothetical protein
MLTYRRAETEGFSPRLEIDSSRIINNLLTLKKRDIQQLLVSL